MPFGRGTHVVCGRCGGAGERPRQRSSKELKREAGRAKLARRALELEALLSSHPAVTGCVVEPQAPGKLACAHVQLVPSAPDVSVANSNTLLLASIMGWLDQETRQVGEPARADGALRFFPGGVHVVEQLPRRPSVPPAKRPWDQCDACDGSGLVAAAGASNISQPVEAGPLIAVVGGGIGGAALAVALQQRGMRVVVYERDESFSSRRQGYGLTMQQGGTALCKLGLQPEGVSSSSHFVFNTSGEVLGFFGRALSFNESTGPDVTLSSNCRGSGDPQAAADNSRLLRKNGRKNRQMYNLHVPRQRLRERLLDLLAPGTVQWGRVLTRFEPTEKRWQESAGRSCDADDEEQRPPAPVRCWFADGSSEEVAVLVGADGISSMVRRQLEERSSVELHADRSASKHPTVQGSPRSATPHKVHAGACPSMPLLQQPLEYLGVIVVLGIVAEVPLLRRRIVETVDGTTRIYMMAFTEASSTANVGGCSGTAAKCSSRNDDHTQAIAPRAARSCRDLSMWQLSWRMPEQEARQLASDRVALKAEVLRRCGSWHEPIPTLLAATAEDDIAGYAVCDRHLPSSDEELRETCRLATGGGGYCTLLGDAAHPMSPFKGQGANQALLDAVLLAQELSWSCIGPPGLQRGGGSAGGEGEAGGSGCSAKGNRRTVDEALLAYERAMFARVTPKVLASREAVDILHSSLAVAVDLNESSGVQMPCGHDGSNASNIDSEAAAKHSKTAGSSIHRSSGDSYDATWREGRVWAVEQLKEVGVGAWCGSDLDASVVRALSGSAHSGGASSLGRSPNIAAEPLQPGRPQPAIMGAPPAAYCAKVRRSRDRARGGGSLSKGKVPRVEVRTGSSVQ